MVILDQWHTGNEALTTNPMTKNALAARELKEDGKEGWELVTDICTSILGVRKVVRHAAMLTYTEKTGAEQALTAEDMLVFAKSWQ